MSKQTSDYGKFIFNPINRTASYITPTEKKQEKDLEQSMKTFGFADDKPISVIKTGNGKLMIKDGHHRFLMAKRLKIPLYYIVGKSDIPIHLLNSTEKTWTLPDYLTSYVNDGRHPYIVVKKYNEETGIGLHGCIAMLAGESAGSSSYLDRFKRGTYQLGDPDHANKVADIIRHCKKTGIKFATIAAFVRAISKIAWVEEFDIEVFKKKISRHSRLIKRQPTLEDYINMFAMVYNYGSREKIPLSFFADEMARKRKSKTLGNKESKNSK